MTKLVSPPSDAVSELLRTFAVRSTVFCISELRAPWAFRVSDEPVAKFHLVLEGSALLSYAGESFALAGGDLVVLPRGIAHTLAGDRGAPAPPLEELIAEQGLEGGIRLRYGGAGQLTRLLCGGFDLMEGIPASTLDLFPDAIHVPYPRAGGAWLAPLLAELNAEAEDGRAGASAIVGKIADVFLAQALRVWLLDGEGDELADPRQIREEPIAKAVRALNSRPSDPWTLDLLARHVGLSRTALATKFRQEVGEPPMRYLSDVRLRRAARELTGGWLTLHEVARRASYETDAAFAKAFKRRFGLAPGAYRDRAGEPPAIELVAIS
jgi:AraC-like DNA-binding protein